MQTTQIARKAHRIVAELSDPAKPDAVDIFFPPGDCFCSFQEICAEFGALSLGNFNGFACSAQIFFIKKAATYSRVVLLFHSVGCRARFPRRCELPLTGPVPEGEKFFCPTCGALYSVTRTQAGKTETNTAKCVVCLRLMDQSDSSALPEYKLIHRPEDA
jgi:predicted RNA-binding Zn-ribbon protein involved in translation (DUF1610 family)